MKLISIVLPCYNEEANIPILYDSICNIINKIDNYNFELLFIDNCSKDKSVEIIEELSKKDKRVKAIVNANNYGTVKSPYYGLLQAYGDAVIMMASDLQDPPEMIEKFISRWEKGAYIVAGVKTSSEESKGMYFLRSLYYKAVKKLSANEQIEHFTGFGLYDKKVIDVLRELNDPYPYLRGIITELGFKVETIAFKQPARLNGKSKNNFFTLYDFAILGIVSQSKLPMRLLTIGGFVLSIFSMLLSILFIILKLCFWNEFPIGIIPILCGIFFFASVQLFFIGLLGEYVMLIYTKVANRPLVVENRRINFKEV